MRRFVLLALVVIGAAVTTSTPTRTVGVNGPEQVLFADGDDYDTGSG